MTSQAWKRRLSDAIEASGRSQRDVSMAAGKGPGYVHSILVEGKDPTVGSLLDICQALNVSVIKVLGGLDMSPSQEEFLRLLDRSDDDIQRSILSLLSLGRTREDSSAPTSASGRQQKTKLG